MTTPKQQRAADMKIMKLAGKLEKTDGQILLDAGYSKAKSLAPTHVFKSKGVVEYMAKHNLTPERFASLFSADLEVLDARDRFPHLKLLAEITGIKENNLNINYSKSDEAIDLLSQLLSHESQSE